MTSSSSEGLTGDPARQAVPSLRGYSYQVWQSVHRWLKLRKDEVLYLEGAEDLDIVGPGRAETIQVRDRRGSGSVTLQSKGVLKSITHFWELQARHPDLSIHFRFLTTVERGHERQAPFDDMKGLDYWDRCKLPGLDLRPLRQFLQRQEILPESLRLFIATAEDATLRERLITRIEWDTGNEPKEFIEELVKREVIYFGRQDHIPPSESEKVVPHLLKHVWDVICQGSDRRLVYVDFMRLFEHVTTELVSKHVLSVYRQMSAAIGASPFIEGMLGSLGALPTIQFTEFQMFPPPLPDKVARRTILVSSLRQQLQRSGFLILRGSTGMGKSTLAALIAGTEAEGWTWLSLGGPEPEQNRELLYKAALMAGEKVSSLRVVLDDLDVQPQPAAYEHALMGFLHATLSRGGHIIVTTRGEMPSRVTSRFPVTDLAIDVPPFDDNDIRHLLREHGCPSEDLLEPWSFIIIAKTRGHPQLVHASVRNLAARGWPQPQFNDLAATTDLDTVRQEARTRLQAQIPSESARTLAYRLSLLGQPFRRDHALHLGAQLPSLTNPGEAFDLLVGPWAERVNETYYQLCPLLDGAGREIWSVQQVTELQKAIAETLLVCQPLTLLEAGGILRHGLASGAVTPVLATVAIFKDAPAEAWPRVAQEFLWLTWLGLSPGEQIFPPNAFVSTMLRFFQFKIAVELDSETLAPLIAAAWEREIEAIHDHQHKSFMRLLFLVLTIIRFQVPLSQTMVVSRTAEATRLIQDLATPLGRQPLERGDRGAAQELLVFAIPRCKTADDLDEFLSALVEQSDEMRQAILWPFQANDYCANLLCGKVWLYEASRPSPNWARCIALFERTITLSSAWGLHGLTAAAYHALAVIQDEYLHDPQMALAVLDRGRGQLGERDPVLENARAMVLFRSQRYQEALQIWETVLPHWPQGRDTGPAFAYRHAGICAAEVRDWQKAGEMALKGVEAAYHVGLPVMSVGLRADHAFALWKCGDTENALASFAQVLEAFATLPDPQNDPATYALHLRVRHAIAWMLEERRGRHALFEPPAGFFSDPEIPESSRNQRLPEVSILWANLAKVEYEVETGDAVFRRLEVECVNSPLPEAELIVSDLRIRYHLQRLQVATLVADAVKLFNTLEAVRTRIQDNHTQLIGGQLETISLVLNDPSTKAALITELFFAVLIVFISKNIRENVPIETWKSEAIRLGVDWATLEAWFGFVEEAVSQSYAELVATIRESEEREKKLLAALFLSATEFANPEDRFYADIVLVITVHDSPWRKEAEGAVAGLISRGWSRVVSQQLFALRSPSVTAPAIRAACDDSDRGLKKAAKILLAAKNAVWLSLPEHVLQTLRELAALN